MAALAVLRPGDWVRFDGGEHEVLAVAGTSVRLRSAAGSHSLVLASYLMAAPEAGRSPAGSPSSRPPRSPAASSSKKASNPAGAITSTVLASLSVGFQNA